MTAVKIELVELLYLIGLDDVEITINGIVTPAEKPTWDCPGSPVESEVINVEADGWQDKTNVKPMSSLISFLTKICKNNPIIEKELIEQAELDREVWEIDKAECEGRI